MQKTYYIKFITYFLILTVSSILYSCKAKPANSVPKEFRGENAIVLTAWNEDSVNSVQLGMSRNKRFYYTLSDARTATTRSPLFFSGTWLKKGDTLLLSYDAQRLPAHFKQILIIEMQGHYLIQPLDSAEKRIFLRIQESADARRSYRPRPWEN